MQALTKSSICIFILILSNPVYQFAQQVKLMLPIGHTSAVMSAAYNNDGTRIVTTSQDKTAKIWDAATGDLLADLKGHTAFVYTAKFSPDGKKIVTGSFDKTIKVWDAISGELLFTAKHNDRVFGVHFTKDGKKILSCSSDNTAKVWDASGGKLLNDFKGHTSFIQTVSAGPDGKKIATASYDSTARIWDAETNTVLHTLQHSNIVYSAKFSSNGKLLLTASADKSARIYDVSTGKLIAELKGHNGEVWMAEFSSDDKMIATAARDGSAKLWSTTGARLLHDLKGHVADVWYIQFSPDNKKIVTASGDKTARIWDVATGRELFNIAAHNLEVRSAIFSPDGKKILTASDDRSAKIWDAGSGKLFKNYKGYTSGLWSVVASPDGDKIITASGDNTVKVWSIKEGRIIYELKGHTDSIFMALFSPDIVNAGKKILTVSKDKTAKIWDADNGNLLSELKKHSEKINTAQFSPGGKYIATASEDKTIKFWDASNGVYLNEAMGHTSGIISIQFSNDDRKLVSASRDSTARVWEASTGKLIAELRGHKSRLLSAEFNPAGTRVVTTSVDGLAKVFDAAAGSLITDLKGHTGPVSSAKYSPDGTKILTAAFDGLAKIWDAETGALIKDLKGHSFNLRVANWAANGTKVITASRDNSSKVFDVETGKIISDMSDQPGEVDLGIFTKGDERIVTSAARATISIWDPKTANLLYTFFTVGGSDFLVVDKEGHYDGTEAARKLLYFTCGTEKIGLEQVKDRLWVPNLAERLAKNETINAAKLSDLNICAYTPQVEKVDKGTGYHFKITPRTGGLGETVLYVNNIEVQRYKSSDLQKSGNDFLLSMKAEDVQKYFVPGRENRVLVKSFVTNNDVSSRGVEVEEKATAKSTAPPNLHAVIIGVSDYKGDGLDLKYAAKDATDISNAISLSAGKLLGKEHVFVYNLNTGKDHYQLPEKKSIKNLFIEIGKKATSNDILLIFFAGHGVLEGDKKQFYFLTADASMGSVSGAVKEVGIGIEELMDWMKPSNIKAQKRIMILDACHSGSAINQIVDIGKGEYLAARNDDKSQEIKQLDKLNEKSGMYILAASASNQSAYEMGKYSQGLLTYSLLKVIKEHPELLEQSKYLNVSNWFNQTVKVVSDIVRESNLRQEPQLVTTTNFNIGIVDDELLAKIILPNEKPLFATSNFQNSDEAIADDDLELSKLINQQLNDIASRSIDGAINFITSTNAPDAWTLTGRYTVKDEEVAVRINIKQNKAVKNSMEVKGKKSDLKTLAEEIVAKATEWILKK